MKGYFFMFWQAAFWVKVYIRFLWRNEVYKETSFQKNICFLGDAKNVFMNAKKESNTDSFFVGIYILFLIIKSYFSITAEPASLLPIIPPTTVVV